MVADPAPWRDAMVLLKYRAKGHYSRKEFDLFLRPCGNPLQRMLCYLIALIPASLANFIAVAYVLTFNRTARLGLFDLLDSEAATVPSRWLARLAPLRRAEGMYSGPGRS
jgi:hypothetical protein